MLRFLFGLVLVAALAAAAAFVPVHGRTIVARWQAAGSATEFFLNALDEARHPGSEKGRAHSGHDRHAAPSRPAPRPHPGAPTERYSDRDRAALDRIIAGHGEQR